MAIDLLHLPLDVLGCILSHLDVSDFLNLTSSCSALHCPIIAHDESYWRQLSKAHVPSALAPVIASHHNNWRAFYKRFHTQSRPYAWGIYNELGPSPHNRPTWHAECKDAPTLMRGISTSTPLLQMQMTCVTYMFGPRILTIVSDDSTCLLDASGRLLVHGTLDWHRPRLDLHTQRMRDQLHRFTRLTIESGTVNDVRRSLNDMKAIKHVAVGAQHITALCESGSIWSWHSFIAPAVSVTRYLLERGIAAGSGHVKAIFAGCEHSAALIHGTGLVIWRSVSFAGSRVETDLAHIVVPGTSSPRGSHGPQAAHSLLNPVYQYLAGQGCITQVLLLEEVLLCSTSTGQVYAADCTFDHKAYRLSSLLRVRIPDTTDCNTALPLRVTGIRGGRNEFALITDADTVLISYTWYLDRDTLNSGMMPPYEIITALQRTGVISVAFGYKHFIALHGNGTVTSYGYQGCDAEALGLGSATEAIGALRGRSDFRTDDDDEGNENELENHPLIPGATRLGRQVWFERAKHDWLSHLARGGCDPLEAKQRLATCTKTYTSDNFDVRLAMSDWVELRSREFETRYGGHVASESKAKGKLVPHFAYAIATGVSCSGALVLHDDELISKLHQQYYRKKHGDENTNNPFPEQDGETAEDKHGSAWEHEPFPRLRLPNGGMMPGTIRFDNEPSQLDIHGSD